jgi:hypothetical protein
MMNLYKKVWIKEYIIMTIENIKREKKHFFLKGIEAMKNELCKVN